MRKNWRVFISKGPMDDILRRAKEADKNLRAKKFVDRVDKFNKEGRLSLTPKQFVYLCGIAGVDREKLTYKVGVKRTYH